MQICKEIKNVKTQKVKTIELKVWTLLSLLYMYSIINLSLVYGDKYYGDVQLILHSM